MPPEYIPAGDRRILRPTRSFRTGATGSPPGEVRGAGEISITSAEAKTQGSRRETTVRKPSDLITRETTPLEKKIYLIADIIRLQETRNGTPITVEQALNRARTKVADRVAAWGDWRKPPVEIAGMLLHSYVAEERTRNKQ